MNSYAKSSSAFACQYAVLCLLSSWVNPAEAQHVENREGPSYALDVRLHITEQTNYHLNVTFTNLSPSDLTFFSNFVPVGKFGITLVLIETDAEGTRLPSGVIGDPPLRPPVNVRAGEHLQGEINLNKRCPKLVSTLEMRDVVVFWTYQPEPRSAPPLERTGGWLTIPKLRE